MLFLKVKEHFDLKLPFVVYCKPNSNRLIAFLQRNDSLFELESTQSGFAFVSFDNKKRFCLPESHCDIIFEKAPTTSYIFGATQSISINPEIQSAHQDLVALGIQEIEKGTLKKVVLSRSESIEVPQFDFELSFLKLIQYYKSSFKYLFYHPKIGFWMGATPEQFLKITNKTIQTVALAGTVLNTSSSPIQWTAKEIEEQQIVTDFIVNRLSKFSHQIEISEPYNYEAGSLTHIKTDIKATLDTLDHIDSILEEMHPTPAVCGFPKDEAKTFILNNEGYDREFYAGFLGEWNKDFLSYKEGMSDLFVNLRCMKWEENTAKIFVGGGVNKGSNPQKEFTETVNKSQIMRKVL
ncbi:chorismate-binding protein [Flavobacterium aciduliphilum]|uniref:Isochorismate synthase n=1 Tax=Flavobacterium aciduliphilum TaxID=1101402 RepID=A0A328YA09_9FLAO|nr:chorismate-binding protein [Flavobacterium aciduliphilum]RAR70014.1 isochorismate synthase [Flavobacterium aciduliphilum]